MRLEEDQQAISRERKISPKFSDRSFFRGRPRGMSMSKCVFFQDLEGLTEVFGQMSAGTSGRKLSLWADSSFLNKEKKIRVTLITHTHLFKGGKFTPLIREGGVQKHYRTRGFRQSTPLIKG